MPHDARIPRWINRTPWARRNGTKDSRKVLLARGANLDQTIHKGVRHLSAKQKPDTPPTDATVQDFSPRKRIPVHTNRDGLNHWTTQELGLQCNTNNRRPWVYKGRNIPPMPHHGHQTPNCTAVLPTRIPLVWTPVAPHLGP